MGQTATSAMITEVIKQEGEVEVPDDCAAI